MTGEPELARPQLPPSPGVVEVSPLSSAQAPDVSYAVILTRGAERAAIALDSIEAQRPSSELLLILNDVDAAMRDLAAQWARRGARVLHDGADVGVILAYNLALREARGAFVCTVHEDSELRSDCAQRLLATLLEHPEAGAVGPSVDVPGVAAANATILWRDGATSFVAAEVEGALHGADYAGTNCLMLRRDAARAVGGFDAHFFPAIYGDVDLSLKLWDAGWAVLRDGRARSAHRTGAMVDATRGPRRGPRVRAFLVERNRERFVARHGEWLARQPMRADPHDASHPGAAEVAEALSVADVRWRSVSRPPDGPRPDRIVMPEDLTSFVAERRRQVEDEFLERLIEREAALSEEAVATHRAYADLHAEFVALSADTERVHLAYAELHAELVRVHGAHADLHADLERVRAAHEEPAPADR